MRSGDKDRESSGGSGGGSQARVARRAPGKRTLTDRLVRAARAEGQAAKPSADDVATAAIEGKGSGVSVDPAARGPVESHLGAKLDHVRVHEDEGSREAAAAIGARAFTHGNDVFLGPGESQGDLGLMAHELTHVVQQDAGARRLVQRQVRVGQAEDPAEHEADRVAAEVTSGAPGALIVGDDAAPAAGQLRRAEFLARLHDAVIAASSEALGPLWSAAGCPYIEAWFARNANADAATLERLGRRFGGAGARTAGELITAACARARAGVARWRAGEDVSADLAAAGVSGEAAAAAAGPPAAEPGAPSPSPAPAPSPAPGGTAHPKRDERAQATALVDQLGEGTGLSGSAARVSDALGGGLGDVQIHTGPQAQRKAAELDARAFTVGSHVAFGAGEYAPGTPVGDAILAHELAHVQQQQGSTPALAPATETSPALEGDADHAAQGAMARLYTGGRGLAQRSRAALSSGYSLQRCSRQTTTTAAPTTYAGAHDTPAGTVGHYSGAQVDTFLSTSAAVSSYISTRVSGGQVLAGHIHFYNTADFTEAWVRYAQRHINQATGSLYTEAEARAWVPRAFTEGTEIHINENDGEPRTAIHEGIHLYENAALVGRIGFWAREGVCEYFAQIVIGEQGATATAGQNPALAQPLASARLLAAATSRDAVARAFFSGDVAGLETAVDAAKGAGTFGRWVGFMNRSTPDYAAADALLR